MAPLYLVLLAGLAPLAALGLAVGVFQGLLGYPELTCFVPLAAGVLLVALGSDYNIFLVGRIWSEAERLPLNDAIVAAGSGASHAITAAGLVLAAFAGPILSLDRRLPRAHRPDPRGRRAGRRALELAEPPPRHPWPDPPAGTGGRSGR